MRKIALYTCGEIAVGELDYDGYRNENIEIVVDGDKELVFVFRRER